MAITNAALAQQISELVDYWRTRDVQFAEWLGGVPSGGPYSDGRYPLTDYLGVTQYLYCPAALESGVASSASSAATQAALAGAAKDAALVAQGAAEGARDSALAYRDAAQAARDLALQYRDDAANSTAIANTHRTKAKAWASNPEDAVVESGLYSALHYASKAQASNDNIVSIIESATSDAIAAATADAAASASAAASSATAASGSATDASDSATAAAGSASAAATSAGAADTSADAAAASAAAAATFDPALYVAKAGSTMTGPLSLAYTYVSAEIPLKVDSQNGYGMYVAGQNTLNFNFGVDSDSGGWVNYRGYNNGTTRFRDLIIGDGKNSPIATFTGSSKLVTLYGDTRSRGSGRFTGWRDGASGNEDGPGVEIGFVANAGVLVAYDRTTSTYYPVVLGGSGIRLEPQTGHVTNTGAYSAGGWLSSYPAGHNIQIGVTGGFSYVHSHNSSTGTYPPLRLTGSNVDVELAFLSLQNKNALQGDDTWLRLNSAGAFTSGTYTPGLMRADGGFQVVGTTMLQPSREVHAIGYRWADDTNFYIYNTFGNTYGSWRIGGARSGYVGLLLDDTSNLPTFMSNGGTIGVYCQAGPRGWLWYQDGTNFSVVGNFSTSGDVRAFSDERLKEDIKTIDSALAKVSKLRGVSFKWRDRDEHSLGFVAQEVERVLPEVVAEVEDRNRGGTYKTVAYANVVAVLVEAIKELNTKIERLS